MSKKRQTRGFGSVLSKQSQPQALANSSRQPSSKARRFGRNYINSKALFRFISFGLSFLALAALYGALTGPSPMDGAIYAAVTVTVIGIPIVGYEVLFRRWLIFSPSRRWPFGLLVVIKSSGYAFWILLGTAIGARLTHHSDAPPLTDLFAHRETIVATVSVLHGCAGWGRRRSVSMLRISPSCRTNTTPTVATIFRGRSDA